MLQDNTIKKSITSLIQENISLHDKNWFATGGCARYFVQPQTAQEFQEALYFSKVQQLPLFILGQGANILISDQGFDGLVIRPQLNTITIESTDEKNIYLRAGTGIIINDLIEWCLAHQILGLEEFSGIPGTVGGSVYINLHYYDFLLEQFIVQATVIHKATGAISTVDRDWFCFGYDHSKLHVGDYFLIDAVFKLTKTDALGVAFAHGRRTEIIRHRYKRYPYKNTCGSFFRNFHEHEVTHISAGRKMIYAAYYLDKVGIKGQLSVGDAVVSYQHANMIVNNGSATSTDIITLACKMQQLVYEKFGVHLQPECQLIGFNTNPLY